MDHDVTLLVQVGFGTVMTETMKIMELQMVAIVLVLIIDFVTPVAVPSHHEFVQIVFCNYSCDLAIELSMAMFQITSRSQVQHWHTFLHWHTHLQPLPPQLWPLPRLRLPLPPAQAEVPPTPTLTTPRLRPKP